MAPPGAKSSKGDVPMKNLMKAVRKSIALSCVDIANYFGA